MTNYLILIPLELQSTEETAIKLMIYSRLLMQKRILLLHGASNSNCRTKSLQSQFAEAHELLDDVDLLIKENMIVPKSDAIWKEEGHLTRIIKRKKPVSNFYWLTIWRLIIVKNFMQLMQLIC